MYRTPFLVLAALSLAACADAPTASSPASDAARFASGGGSPSFHSADYVIASGGSHAHALALSFKQTGLGSFSNVNYTLSDVSTIVSYRCLNKQEGGPDLSAQPHQHDFGSLSVNADIPPRNGQTTASLYLPVDLSQIDCQQGGLHPSVVAIQFVGIDFTWGAGGQTFQGPVPPGRSMSAPVFDVVVAGAQP